MTARRLLRAVTRPFRRLLRAWALADIRYQMKHSAHQLERMREARTDLANMEASQHRRQVRLEMRKREIERART